MVFHEGQRVRAKNQNIVGRIEKKLSSLDDVYVVLFDELAQPEERLVRGADLEAIANPEQKRKGA